ncbi:MAG: ribonuclease activity regulator RraA [Rhodospirillales bacterium]|nr:ribonuclease activity regulator RraA [Rhodospirillales bacterium]MDE0712504.1 ribonuclease activity regulator RraA [Rhodospirillales bacterium]
MDAELRAALTACSTATITMQLLKRGIRATAMRGVAPLAEGQGRVAGEAYTVRFIPMREDLSDPAVLGARENPQRRAIEECPAGAILVMDGLGNCNVGTLGDILAERLRVRGVAACVTDSAVRDAEAVVATGFPVWCGGRAAPPNNTGLAMGDLQTPIGCGGVAVIPGDVLVCDGDGVAVIPTAMVESVAADAVEQERVETFVLERIRAGDTVPGTYPPNEETLSAYEIWKQGHD